ncbi:MAG: hypothetical protein IJQ16_06775, partial [Selenomonadaceae bacterium]|nr:hypothetical protein [Selenomonadaceae bacterium]
MSQIEMELLKLATITLPKCRICFQATALFTGDVKKILGCRVEVVNKSDLAQFQVIPKHWTMVRTFASKSVVFGRIANAKFLHQNDCSCLAYVYFKMILDTFLILDKPLRCSNLCRKKSVA